MDCYTLLKPEARLLGQREGFFVPLQLNALISVCVIPSHLILDLRVLTELLKLLIRLQFFYIFGFFSLCDR